MHLFTVDWGITKTSIDLRGLTTPLIMSCLCALVHLWTAVLYYPISLTRSLTFLLTVKSSSFPVVSLKNREKILAVLGLDKSVFFFARKLAKFAGYAVTTTVILPATPIVGN